MENDANYLMISGMKHYQFCPRRWALVHLEQQWQENALTLEGHYMHEKVHDDGFTESRGSMLLSRGMPVRSEKLQITGVCDMVELHKSSEGIPIQGRAGKWLIYPIEYKHGKPDERGADELQLCAQAMCLEEMLVTNIAEGAIYYGQLKRRMTVSITTELRQQALKVLSEMHHLFDNQYTPKAKMTKVCKNCSMVEICQPELSKRMRASEYVRRMLEE